MKKMINTLVEWISVILTAIVIAFIITQFIRPTLVRGESMYPTLSEDDYLIINKITQFVNRKKPPCISAWRFKLYFY